MKCLTLGTASLPMLLCLSLTGLSAEQAEFEDEAELLALYGDTQMISIATGKLQPLAQAPAVASVITADDILDMGATDLDDILETVPGLHVTYSPLGYNPIYVFRGIHSNYNPQVLMLINGVPLHSLFQGDRSLIWGGMPVRAIERIEVIRGPGSALYGADAFAGVINIITQSGKDIDTNELGLLTGSHDTRDGWAKFSSDWWDFTIGMVFEFHKTEGQQEVIDADLQSILDRLTGTFASKAPGPVSLSRENWDIRLDISRGDWRFRSGLQRRRDWGNGVGVAEALDPDNRWASDRINADLNYRNITLAPHWELQAQVSYLDTSIETENNMHIFPAFSDLGPIGLGGIYPDGLIGNPESFEQHIRSNLTAIYTRLEQHQLRGGIGYDHSDLYRVRERKNFGIDPATGQPLTPGSPVIDVSDTPYVYLSEGSRENLYVYVQDIWHLADDWELTTGVRSDYYSDFGSTTNPRVALVWSTSRTLTSKLLYGRAFRAPAFAETRAINNPVVLGNPDLAPETLNSYELAFDYRATEDLKLALNLFSYDWRDIIKFTPDANGNTKTANNTGQQSGHGFEVDLQWRPGEAFRFNANYAWQDSEDRSTGAQTVQAPGSQAFVSMNWTLTDNIMLYSQLNWVMSRVRDPQDLRPDIANYALLNLALHYQNDAHTWGAQVKVNNLLDTDAREPSSWSFPTAAIPGDLPLDGRNAHLQFYVKF